jgi:hypothetical protein
VTFKSPAKTVTVNPLPPHPLKDVVSVGEYKMRERMTEGPYETGQSITYTMEVGGEGNIASMDEPLTKTNNDLVIYDPAITMNINRDKGSVFGSKTFQYYLEPREPGKIEIADYIQFVYFDPNRAVYDTLKPRAVFTAIGESLQNQTLANNEVSDAFYDRIDSAQNNLISMGKIDLWKLIGNSVSMIAIVCLVFFVWRYRRN